MQACVGAATLSVACLPMHAQVMQLQGGASTVGETQGMSVAVYQPDAMTRGSLGYANGMHLGFSRQVQSGNGSMTVGDSTLSLTLPTDLPGDARSMDLRGVLMERRSSGSSASFFAGWTGNGYRNAFFSSVAPVSPVAIATAEMTLTPELRLSTVAVQGTRSSMLASAAWKVDASTDVAATAGVTDGKGIFRMAARSHGTTWQAEGNYTSGALRLQPEPTLASLNLERIGWNLSANKHFGNWLWIDGARHEYNTGDATDAASVGIAAGRSVMYEGGATVHFGHAEAGGRLLQSSSGSQTGGGVVLLAGWHTRRLEVRGTGVNSMAADGTWTHSASIDTTERITSRLQLTQGTNFATGSPTFDFGGSLEGRWGSVFVDHRETYVPFGTQTGFHRVLSVGVRLHLRSTELSAEQVTGRGLPPIYTVAANAFHGDSLGVAAAPVSRMDTLPKFAVEGRVLTMAGEPVRGAAVIVGRGTVYTDSDGHFLARQQHAQPVRVELDTASFVTAESYRALDGAMTVMPQSGGGALQLRVERCGGCLLQQAAQQMTTDPAQTPFNAARKHSAVRRAASAMVALTHRMVQMKAGA